MISADWIVIISGVLAVASVAITSILAKKVNCKLDLSEHKVAHLEGQISTISTGAIGMGHRILALEGKITSLAKKADVISDTENFAYSQAEQMFAQGADIETVASNCGFSNSEAELMALIQKRMKQEVSAPIG